MIRDFDSLFTRIVRTLCVYFLPFRGGSGLKGCMARIVPNYSAFRKRKRSDSVLPVFEIALVLVRLDHVARFIVNTNRGIM
jgi:hypothetical protein